MDQVLDPVHGSRLATDSGIDAYFMDRALALAWRAAGCTQPNPLVGAVVVRNGRVVGEGFHETCGQSHAEIIALEQAGEAARGATLYSTLEPCAHHGRTPPCVDAILASGIARVVAATIDPDPRVDGEGVAELRRHKIDVSLGCRAEAAFAVNLPYFKRQLDHGTAVTLKMATTLDGRIASMLNRRDAITGLASQRFVHRLRANHSAVAVGVDTMIVDRPRLDCRTLVGIREPVPVVFDSNLRGPTHNCWNSDRRLYYAVALEANRPRDGFDTTSCRLLECAGHGGRVCVADALDRLAEVGLESVLVEGGAQLFASFVAAGVWDVMHILVAPKLFGDEGVPLARAGMGSELDAIPVDSARLDHDYRVTYFRSPILRALRDRLT